MRALKICLFLPMPSIESLANIFGDEAFPNAPAMVYTVRGLCATYVMVGMFFIILALNAIIPCLGELVKRNACSVNACNNKCYGGPLIVMTKWHCWHAVN